MPNISGQQAIRLLEQWGWEVTRQAQGDHLQLKWPETGKVISARMAGEINDHTLSLACEAMGLNRKDLLSGPGKVLTAPKVKIVRILLAMGGKSVSEKGLATAPLMKAMGHSSSAATTGLLTEMERIGMLRRKVHGKRTHEIMLIGSNFLVKRAQDKIRRESLAEEEKLKVEERAAETRAVEEQKANEVDLSKAPVVQPAPVVTSAAPSLTLVTPEKVEPPITEGLPKVLPPTAMESLSAVMQQVLNDIGLYVGTMEATVRKYDAEADVILKRVHELTEYGAAQRRKLKSMEEELAKLRGQLRRKPSS